MCRSVLCMLDKHKMHKRSPHRRLSLCIPAKLLPDNKKGLISGKRPVYAGRKTKSEHSSRFCCYLSLFFFFITYLKCYLYKSVVYAVSAACFVAAQTYFSFYCLLECQLSSKHVLQIRQLFTTCCRTCSLALRFFPQRSILFRELFVRAY